MNQFEVKDGIGRCEDHKDLINKVEEMDKFFNKEIYGIWLELNSLKDNKISREEFDKLRENIFEIKESNFKVQASLAEVINNISEDRDSRKRLFENIDKVFEQMSEINKQNLQINSEIFMLKQNQEKLIEISENTMKRIDKIEERENSKILVVLGDSFRKIDGVIKKIKSKNKIIKYIMDGVTWFIGLSIVWIIINFAYYLINQTLPFDIFLKFIKDVIL